MYITVKGPKGIYTGTFIGSAFPHGDILTIGALGVKEYDTLKGAGLYGWNRGGAGVNYGTVGAVSTTTGVSYGLYGKVYGGAISYAVYGKAENAAANYGVYGDAESTDGKFAYGVYGRASGAGTNYAGYFLGRVNVAGTDGEAVIIGGNNPTYK